MATDNICQSEGDVTITEPEAPTVPTKERKSRTDTFTRKLPPIDEILRLRREGWTNKHIAHRYKVTQQAIYTAIRRAGVRQKREHERQLKKGPMPCMTRFTEEEQAFMQSYSVGEGVTASALKAWPNEHISVAQSRARKLLKEPAVQGTIRAIMEANPLLKLEHRLGRLAEHVDSQDGNVSLKALDMSFKLGDEYPANKSQHLHVHADISPVDLTKYRRVK